MLNKLLNLFADTYFTLLFVYILFSTTEEWAVAANYGYKKKLGVVGGRSSSSFIKNTKLNVFW